MRLASGRGRQVRGWPPYGIHTVCAVSFVRFESWHAERQNLSIFLALQPIRRLYSFTGDRGFDALALPCVRSLLKRGIKGAEIMERHDKHIEKTT